MNWILLIELPTENEANIIKGKLESEGISARVTCDNLGGLYSGITPALASAKLYVLPEDVEKAKKIIKH